MAFNHHRSQSVGDGYWNPSEEDIEAYVRRRFDLQDASTQMPNPLTRQHAPHLPSHLSHSSLPGYSENGHDTASEGDMEDKQEEDNENHGGWSKESWRMRLRHFTWAFFTFNMATGGIASVIDAIPFRFHGLYAIGYIFFILNLLVFILNTFLISCRFALHPKTFRTSLMHPSESLFVPASIVGFGIILTNLSQYGMGHSSTLQGLFWFDSALAIIGSVGIYLVLWSTQTFTIATMLPTWGLPIYPLLIIGPHAGVLSRSAPPAAALSIIVGGSTLQGIGFVVSLMIYSAFIYRLMTQKLPKDALRPGMFVSVGPSAFTAAALITMAGNLDRSVGKEFMGDGLVAAFILRVIANWFGIILWGTALWFFFVSVGAHWNCVTKKDWSLTFTLSWFSFVFPNTALALATLAVGKAFDTRSIQILGTIMAVCLIVIWAVVVGMMIRAIKLRQILWPQMGEDREEGGFRENM